MQSVGSPLAEAAARQLSSGRPNPRRGAFQRVIEGAIDCLQRSHFKDDRSGLLACTVIAVACMPLA